MFIVATANDVSQFPPELLRKGRFDQIKSDEVERLFTTNSTTGRVLES